MEPESDQGDGSIGPKTPKYKAGTFLGVIHRVVFEKKPFIYSVKLMELILKKV